MAGDHALQPPVLRTAAPMATGGMAVDTSQVIHIPIYVSPILWSVAGTFIFFVLCLWSMVNPGQDDTSLLDQVITVLSTVLFGGACGFFSYIFFFADDYPVVMSPTGLTISFHSKMEVEWKNIIDLKTFSSKSLSNRGAKIVFLELDRPPVTKTNHLTRFLRKWVPSRRFWASIPAHFLDMTHNELIHLLEAYWQTHGNPPATSGLNPRMKEG